MGGSEHKVFGFINKRAFFLRIGAPQHEHKMLALVREGAYYRIGELFPAFMLMASGCALTDGKGRIQEQHALARHSSKLPEAGGSTPKSFLSSLKMFWREGGGVTPSGTEKESPCAWPRPW